MKNTISSNIGLVKEYNLHALKRFFYISRKFHIYRQTLLTVRPCVYPCTGLATLNSPMCFLKKYGKKTFFCDSLWKTFNLVQGDLFTSLFEYDIAQVVALSSYSVIARFSAFSIVLDSVSADMAAISRRILALSAPSVFGLLT